jgi:choline dehydrogenase-like flavoprotein
MIDTSNKEIQSHYDFIVVGAGAAGSVLAAELSASGAQVLVIESGIDVAVMSVSTPGVHLGDSEKARSLARRCNEFAAEPAGCQQEIFEETSS